MALAGIATYYGCAFHDRGVAPSHLFSRYCSNFFREDACDVSSIQASQHQKMGLRGNNCGRLDFNCDDINSLAVNKSLWELASTVAIAISFLLMAVILFPLPYCYLCFLHLYCFKILEWKSSSVPWCSHQTKKTDCDIIHNDHCIFAAVVTICCIFFHFFFCSR